MHGFEKKQPHVSSETKASKNRTIYRTPTFSPRKSFKDLKASRTILQNHWTEALDWLDYGTCGAHPRRRKIESSTINTCGGAPKQVEGFNCTPQRRKNEADLTYGGTGYVGSGMRKGRASLSDWSAWLCQGTV
jgi:hypothetical protein